MNRATDSHVPFPSYCRQRISSVSIFETNSRIAQEWACDSMSRLEEDLSFAENSPLQQRLATDRSIRSSSNGENCLLYTSPSPRDLSTSRMPSSA